MTTKRTYTVPARFYEDHAGRCDFGCPYPSRFTGRIEVELTPEQVEDLYSDADYYSTDWIFMGREYVGLGRSAKATVEALRRQGVQI